MEAGDKVKVIIGDDEATATFVKWSGENGEKRGRAVVTLMNETYEVNVKKEQKKTTKKRTKKVIEPTAD